jgi:hypothetical protein
MTKDPFWWEKYATLNRESLAGDISEAEAKKLVADFEENFPEVGKWKDKVEAGNE